MAYHIWVLIFPIVWATLSETKERQIHLAKPIIQLLSKEFHSAQSHKRPNVIQASVPTFHLSRSSSLWASPTPLLADQAGRTLPILLLSQQFEPSYCPTARAEKDVVCSSCM